MGKKAKEKPKPQETGKPASMSAFAVGLIGVAAGFVIGYVTARVTGEEAPPAHVHTESAPVPNPAAFGEQEAILQAQLRANPGDAHTLVHLGNLYYDHGRFADAVVYYGRALEIEPDDPNVRTDRGTSYYNLGQPEKAIAEFNLSLEVDPAHPQTLYNLGIVYLHGMNDPASSRAAWRRLLEAHPDHPERARIESQLASLGTAGAAAAAPPAAEAPAPSGDVIDLLERMKARR